MYEIFLISGIIVASVIFSLSDKKYRIVPNSWQFIFFLYTILFIPFALNMINATSFLIVLLFSLVFFFLFFIKFIGGADFKFIFIVFLNFFILGWGKFDFLFQYIFLYSTLYVFLKVFFYLRNNRGLETSFFKYFPESDQHLGIFKYLFYTPLFLDENNHASEIPRNIIYSDLLVEVTDESSPQIDNLSNVIRESELNELTIKEIRMKKVHYFGNVVIPTQPLVKIGKKYLVYYQPIQPLIPLISIVNAITIGLALL